MDKAELEKWLDAPPDEILGMYILRDRQVVKPATRREWVEWIEKTYEPKAKERIVAKTRHKGVLVSTVFLGLDHDFSMRAMMKHHTMDKDYRPLVFETMVFGGPLDREMCRYRLREEAEKGHKWLVEEVKKAMAEMAELKGKQVMRDWRLTQPSPAIDLGGLVN